MPIVEREGDTIWVWAEPREHAAVGKIPGASFSGARRQFKLRLSWSALMQLRVTFGAQLQIGTELTAWALEVQTAKEQLKWLGMQLEVPEGWMFLKDSPLYPPQVVGTEFLLLAGGAILADEMGGGKTPQVCVGIRELLDANPGRRALVVGSNAALKHVWQPHLREWTGVDPAMALGDINQRRKAIASDSPVVCISYDNLKTHTRLTPFGNHRYKRCPDCLRSTDPVPPEEVPSARCEAHPKELNAIDWLVVAADEAHKIKDPGVIRSRALKALTWRAPFAWLATGTPMANHETDFWSLLNAVARNEWPSQTEFVDRYCETGFSWGGLNITGLNAEYAAEFHELVAARMIRRPRAVLAPWLPEALPDQVREVTLPAKLRKAYNAMRKDLLAQIEGGMLMAANPLTTTTRLRQLACAMLEEVTPAYDNDAGERVPATYAMVEPSPKLDELEDVLAETDPEPVVVFSDSKQLILLAEQRLTKAGVSWSSFHGGKTDTENDSDMRRWQEGRTRVLLITLAKGAESLTLTRARIITYIMESYSALQMDQSRDRVDRIGQTLPPLRIIIRSKDTIEERVADALADKGVRFEALVRDTQRLKELI